MSSLGEALPLEQTRVRELKETYLSLPLGAGRLAAHLMELSLQRAERAAISGDVVEMLRAHEDLQEWTE